MADIPFGDLVTLAREGLPQRHVTVTGEFTAEARTGRRITMIVDHSPQGWFGTIGVHLVRAVGQGKQLSCVRQSVAVTVTGTLDLQGDGSGLGVRGTTARVGPGGPGPFTRWRTDQARAAEVSLDPRPRTRPGDIQDHLRSLDHSPLMFWLGGEHLAAFRDVHRGEQQVRAAFTCANVPMQGRDAVPRIVDALRRADPERCDLVVIARGGGGLVELSLFDDHEIVTAILRCRVATLVAVGHEQNHPLAEWGATWAVATPTAVHQAVRPVVLGQLSIPEQKAEAARRADQQKQHALDEARGDRDRALSQVRAVQADRNRSAHQRVLEVAREDARDRITARDHLLAIVAAVAAAVAVVLGLPATPVTWPPSWGYQVVPAAVLAAAASLSWLNPRRLGRRTWVTRTPPPVTPQRYQGARTVDAYNRVNAHQFHTASRYDTLRAAVSRRVSR